MQIITGELEGNIQGYPLSRFGGEDNILAVDIETTGLSAQKHRIYLIGCGYWEDDCWKLIQWFDDTGDGEADILTSFLLFTKKFTTLLHYNGRQFDLPFLARRIVWNGLQGTPGAENFPSAMKSLDLYRYVKPFQRLLSLPDCRQQTIEQFLGTGRTEARSGRELVDIYLDYISSASMPSSPAAAADVSSESTKRIDAAMINRLLQEQALASHRRKEARMTAAPSPMPAHVTAVDALGSAAPSPAEEEPTAAAGAADDGADADAAGDVPFYETNDAGSTYAGFADLQLTDRASRRMALLTHNRCDVAGLIAMTAVLGWKDLLQAQISVHRAQANTFRDENGEPQQELILHGCAEGISSVSFRTPVTTSRDGCYCTISGDRITLKIPIYNGKLHHYYANYQDYYYLPELDQAIHKSIATYVDKSHRQQATAETCYTGKVGTFLPQWDKFRSPFFMKCVRDKTAWFPFLPEMKKDKAFFAEYATYVFRHVTEL